MRTGATLLASLALLNGPVTGDDTAPYTNPVCWKEPRLYHPGGIYGAELEGAARRALHVNRVNTILRPPITLSPNRAYAFRLSEEANTGPPSGSTRVSLLVFKERTYVLSIQADEVLSLQDPRWVNEKLIWFRLWLSRLGGVDVLVDVEQEVIVRMEAVADGRILWEQTRETCKLFPHVAGCDEPCTSLR